MAWYRGSDSRELHYCASSRRIKTQITPYNYLFNHTLCGLSLEHTIGSSGINMEDVYCATCVDLLPIE